MILKFTSLSLFALAWLSTPWLAWAHEGNGQDEKEAVKAVYEQMAELAEAGDWENLLSHMTEDAGKQTQTGLVAMAVEMGGEQMDMLAGMIPGMEDARDAAAEALENHGLDELELPSMMQVMGGPEGGMDMEDLEDLEADGEMPGQDETSQKVLDALENVEDRWACLQDLDEALADSPFSMGAGSGLFKGEIANIEVDGDVAHVEIELDAGGGMGGMQMQMPGTHVLFQKVDGQWKYNGMDEEAMMKEMEQMQIPGGGGGGRF